MKVYTHPHLTRGNWTYYSLARLIIFLSACCFITFQGHSPVSVMENYNSALIKKGKGKFEYCAAGKEHAEEGNVRWT